MNTSLIWENSFHLRRTFHLTGWFWDNYDLICKFTKCTTGVWGKVDGCFGVSCRREGGWDNTFRSVSEFFNPIKLIEAFLVYLLCCRYHWWVSQVFHKHSLQLTDYLCWYFRESVKFSKLIRLLRWKSSELAGLRILNKGFVFEIYILGSIIEFT